MADLRDEELARLELEIDRLQIDLGQRDQLIDEQRAELDALKAKPAGMTYAQLFEAVAAALPACVHFCIGVRTWRHPAGEGQPPRISTIWRIWDDVTNHEAPTARSALDMLKAALINRIEVAAASPVAADRTGVDALVGDASSLASTVAP